MTVEESVQAERDRITNELTSLRNMMLSELPNTSGKYVEMACSIIGTYTIALAVVEGTFK